MAVDSKMAVAYEMQVAVGDVAQAMAVLGQTRREEEESTVELELASGCSSVL